MSKITIQDVQTLSKKSLKANHNSHFEVAKKNDKIGYHNLIYVGSQDTYQGCYVVPVNVTKQELWQCHLWLENKQFPNALYELLNVEKLTERTKELITLTWRLIALVKVNENICFAYFNEQDVPTCQILETYVNFLKTKFA